MMKNSAKIQLSEVEKELVNNTALMFAKHDIIRKVYELFGVLTKRYDVEITSYKDLLPVNISSKPPKITRGENYKLLPYVILDHPAIFDKEKIFAVRTMFWWGNFFSITLHLKGAYKNILHPDIPLLLKMLGREIFTFM